MLEVVVEHANQVSKDYSNNQSYDIPDNDENGVHSDIVVADNFELLTATVSVDITHSWRGD